MMQSRIVSRAMGFAAVFVVFAMVAGLAPNRAAAAQDGGSFVSDAYGFSLEWDEDVWTGTVADIDPNVEAVDFESITSYGSIQAFPSKYADAAECLDGMESIFAEDEGELIEDFGVAPIRMDRPEGPPGSEGDLYTYTFVDSDSSLDLVTFLSCTMLMDDEVALQVILQTTPDVYDDVMTEWEDLIAGITIDDSASDNNSSTGGSDGDTGGTGIIGAQYLNDELGFQLEWDGRVWEADQVSNGEDGEGVELTAEASYAYIVGTAGTAVESAQECVDALAANVENGENFANVRTASKRTERPESPRDAAAELLTFTDTTDDSKTIAYLECRPLDGSAVLTIQFATPFENYETELPIWQEVLDSIEIGTATVDANDKQSGEPTSSKGDSVTTPNFGVKISYDDGVWSPKDYSDKEIDQFSFESEFGYAQITGVDGEPDLTLCMQTLVENEQQYATDEIAAAPRRTPRPETVRGAEAELYTYVYEGESGPVDVLVYMECREMASGDGMIAVTFTTFPDSYEEALPAVEALLSGIDG